MSNTKTSGGWVMGGGAAAVLIVLVPLWREFREPSNIAWDAFLSMLLMALAIATFVLQRYLLAHIGEVGEARFNSDGSKKTDG